jgi:hypothetical protein
MVTDPQDLQLTDAQREFLVKVAEEQGRPAQELLADLLSPARLPRWSGTREPTVESAHDLGQRLGLFAALEDGPTDLSTNPRHMEGFGTRADRTGTH